MRDRASGAGGTLTVESAPRKGTTIEMEVPGG
jgi:signal transduction histidine kinase